MSWHLKKNELLEVLMPLYGRREAESISLYYFDARRKHNYDDNTFQIDLKKLGSGQPVQYVTNTSFFYGLELYINDNVLIPRPETEELVYWILSDNKSNKEPLSVLDIGTGSGCIILSLMKKNKSLKGYALDISSSALEVLLINADRLQLDCLTILTDILKDDLAELPKFDLIVSNPPYILANESSIMSASTLENEPHQALFVEGDDPLKYYKRIIELSKSKLNRGGSLYFETSHLHNKELKGYLIDQAMNYKFKADMQGNPRMLKVQF